MLKQEYYTLKELEKEFEVDRGTIRYHVKQRHVEPIRVWHEGRRKMIFTEDDYSKLAKIFEGR